MPVNLQNLRDKLAKRLARYEALKKFSPLTHVSVHYGVKARTLKEVIHDIDLLIEKNGKPL